RVRIAVHHQERILSPSDHQVRSIVARLCRLGKKIEIARFLFEVLHPPGSPERLQFFLRKFLHHYAFASIRLRARTGKSSGHSPLLSFRAESRNLSMFSSATLPRDPAS